MTHKNIAPEDLLPLDVPALSIGRRVLNVNQEQINELRNDLCETLDDTDVMRSTAREIFHPLNRLRSPILPRYEFISIQRHLGSKMLDEEKVKDLADRLKTELADPSQVKDVGTSPVEIRRRGNGPKYNLTVGQSIGVARERMLAKQIIVDFIDSDIPKGIWFSNDRRKTEVVLAFSETEEEAALIGRLKPIVEASVASEREESFPAFMDLDEIGVSQSTRGLESGYGQA